MNLELKMLAGLMRGRAFLILGLSVASGWTTWNGLKLFMVWPIALALTLAVQSILVIATYQLSKMHVAASLRRYLTVAAERAEFTPRLYAALSTSASTGSGTGTGDKADDLEN